MSIWKGPLKKSGTGAEGTRKVGEAFQLSRYSNSNIVIIYLYIQFHTFRVQPSPQSG